MAFKDRLKEARLNLGYTQEQLADKLGMAKSTIAGYEKGTREPNILTVQGIMNALKIDANFLWQDEMEDSLELIVSSHEWDLIKKYRNLDNYGVNAIDTLLDIEYTRCIVKEEQSEYCPTVMKPSYHANLSAGTGLFVFDDVPSKQEPVPSEFEYIDFIIGVSGDSMEPTYNDGDKVMIVKQSKINFGEVGAFMVNGEAFIKELGNDCLISHNEKYAPIQFNESMRIDCIGKVVGKL